MIQCVKLLEKAYCLAFYFIHAFVPFEYQKQIPRTFAGERNIGLSIVTKNIESVAISHKKNTRLKH